jgi:PAS domain S-box-containing protein
MDINVPSSNLESKAKTAEVDSPEKMGGARPELILVLALVFAAFVFAFDLSLPLGVAAGVPYVALVLIGIWLPYHWHVYILAALASALILTGYAVSPSGGILWVVLTNRGLALFAVWVTTFLIAHRKGVENELRETRDELEVRVQQRTTALRQEVRDREEVSRELEKNENRLRLIVETAVDAIITINEKGIVETFNTAAESIFNYPNREVVGKNIRMLMPEPDKAQHNGYLKTYLKTGKARIVGQSREVKGRRKNGNVFPMTLAVSEAVEDGRRYFTGIVRDISAEKEAELRIRLAKDAADKANKAKSEFLSSMSHELRTPMNAILGFSQLLQHSPEHPLTEKQNEYTDLVLKSGDHLLELIDQVLELAKIEAGHISVSVEDVPVITTIEECIEVVSPRAEQNSVTLDFQCPEGFYQGDCPILETDPMRFRQVLFNLLSNAIKYNREGGSVTVDCDEALENMLRISVSDTGEGIPLDQQKNLFRPFERLGREAGAIEGTGIGLTITKNIVSILGGRIGYLAKKEGGSTFWFELPTSGRTTQHNKNASSANAGDKGRLTKEGPAKNKTILYVEDNSANVRLMEEITTRRPGDTLITAPSAEIGLDVAKARLPDLILMDINLPGMDGYDALRKIRSSESIQNIPVIAISADAMPYDIEKGIAAGFHDYITKPLKVNQLLKAIDREFAKLNAD